MKARIDQRGPYTPLRVYLGGLAPPEAFHFTAPFRIGRTNECEVCINNDYVSRVHAEVVFENGQWQIRDLNSSNGVFVDGQRVESATISQILTVRLGIEGPQLSFQVQSKEVEAAEAQRSESPDKRPAGAETMVARYVDHYFGKSATNQAAGEHTMYVRRAFAQVQQVQKRKYGQLIALLAILTLGAGAYAFYLHEQVQRQRALAQDLFYSMKALDVDIANLEKTVMESNSRQGKQVIQSYEGRRREMEKSYDHFLDTLHVYNPKMTEQHRLVLRIARVFGECELDMPPEFEKEINKYIKYWQSSGRLAAAIQTAQEKGYTATISKELLSQGLPPQFFYLALQESNFDPYISGPMTRMGFAKGMWQFVPETATKYGLRLGPLADLRRPDPGDDRDNYEKATKAAALYLKDLYSTDAQASGLLVMACYNWGENQVLPLVRSLPQNPKERNFWRLLSNHRDKIPQETYDYVFYIASAAVIGENPRLFGFNFDNPLANLESN
jgi:membrane-bound lytic murein transglycosylase D